TQEVLDKIKEYEEKYGGEENFASILEQQGTTREALQGVIKTQLYLEKLYSGEASVSSSEVDDYLKTNKGTLVATEEAQQKMEAEKKDWDLYLKKAGAFFLVTGGIWFGINAYNTYKINISGMSQIEAQKSLLQQEFNKEVSKMRGLAQQLKALKNKEVDEILEGKK
ncbi:MAG: hypothetical protein AAB877_03035, partial [Patescibacteria group bacterium]